MMTGTCELNIRIDALDLPNDQAAVERRAAYAIAGLGRVGTVAHRRVIAGHNHKLVVKVWADHIPDDVLHWLAGDLHQDCIAIYYPATGDGRLVGPRADLWVRFSFADFERYEPSASSELVVANPQGVKPKQVEAAMTISIERQAREWIAKRDALVQSRSRVREESGLLLSDKAESLAPDLLPEPLQTEVLRQLGSV
jgi:hypothetical protein